jgi:hypothetical protein
MKSESGADDIKVAKNLLVKGSHFCLESTSQENKRLKAF